MQLGQQVDTSGAIVESGVMTPDNPTGPIDTITVTATRLPPESNYGLLVLLGVAVVGMMYAGKR